MANTVLPWTQYTEGVIGLNHPTLADTDNRSLRALLARSGFAPDGIFYGLPIGANCVNAGSSDFTGTVTARINTAIAAASGGGKSFCFIPKVASDGTVLLPYSGATVTFNASVQMIREGGNPAVYEFDAYGALGDGVTDDSVACQAAETARPSGGILKGTAGKTYLINPPGASPVTALLRILSPGVVDCGGASIKYGGALGAITNGSDGGGVGVVNVLASNVTLIGTIDGNSLMRYPLALKAQQSDILFAPLTISGVTDGASWSGFSAAASVDVTGVAVVGRTLNVGGVLSRPNCPFMDTSNSIVSHGDVTAFILGGSNNAIDNYASAALVLTSGAVGINLQSLGKVGIRTSGNIQESNYPFMDLTVHDLGHNTAECYGNPANGGTAYGLPTGAVVGHVIKTGAHSSWFHYNVLSGSATPPNVDISGGAGADAGIIDLDPSTSTSGGRLVEKHITLTDAATIATDVSLGNQFQVTLANNRTMGLPTNPRKGQRIFHSIIQDGTGGRTLAWNAVFKNTWSDTGNTPNKRSAIAHIYDGTNWNQDGAQAPYV